MLTFATALEQTTSYSTDRRLCCCCVSKLRLSVFTVIFLNFFMYSVAALQKVFNAVQNPQISTYARVIWSRDEVHLGLDGGVHQPYDAKKRINYKWAVLTFKTQQTSSPQYLNQHISLRTSARNARSSSIPLLCVPFRRTSFARQSFSTAAPLTWNSLPHAVLNCDSLL